MKDIKYKNQVLKMLSLVDNVAGDIIEVGIFKGDTSEIITEHIKSKKQSKKYFGIDTFTGYVEEDLANANAASIKNQKAKRWHSSKAEVEQRLCKYSTIVNIYEGDCKKVIPLLIESGIISTVSFVYVDCNLYEPSIKAMRDLFIKMNTGAILAIDEHLTGGETKAIKEFAKEINRELKFFSDKKGPSYYIIK